MEKFQVMDFVIKVVDIHRYYVTYDMTTGPELPEIGGKTQRPGVHLRRDQNQKLPSRELTPVSGAGGARRGSAPRVQKERSIDP
ncbi:hypothetical protein EYF80_051707 [Liparis tanakae]|uniref:Uncharacterized protein n=1 Tax=Liparis tanakae TaxID=230148 RepID=A0A4Z2FAF6_9TELE|nr:hypothetical protein EYF80_051707 [Liparis tanakae]